MGLKGQKSKEEEAPYMQPLAGGQDVEISGGQPAPEEGSKAALLKSASPPTAPQDRTNPKRQRQLRNPLFRGTLLSAPKKKFRGGKILLAKYVAWLKKGNLLLIFLNKQGIAGSLIQPLTTKVLMPS